MIRALPVLLLLGACEPPTLRVAGVRLDLFTPAEDVDPMAGADVLTVQVRDMQGQVIAEGSAAPGQPLPLPGITEFGPVEVIVTARAGSTVISAARSGPIRVQEGDEQSIPLLFLPVNEAIPLIWRPNAHRIGHVPLDVGGGQVLIVGGRDPATRIPRADSELWSIESGFGGDGPVLPSSMAEPGVAQLGDGSWILAGGQTGASASAVVVHVSEDGGTLSALQPLPQPERDPCVVPHPKLGALVLGSERSSQYVKEGRAGESTFGWGDIGGCAGQDGFVVVAGGSERWGLVDLSDEDVAWPVDFEAAGTWFPDLPALSGVQVAPLPDGRFFIGGGYGFEASRTTRIADPSRREIAEGPELDAARAGGQASLWRGGHVVLSGGFSDASGNQPVRSVDLHHADEGHALSVDLPVTSPALTVLDGGTLVLTGGLDDDGQPAGAYGIVPWLGDDG